MSPLSNSKMSPFRRHGGCGDGRRGGVSEHAGGEPGGGDPRGRRATTAPVGGCAASRSERSAGEAAGAALPGSAARRDWSRATAAAVEQRDRRGGPRGGDGPGARAVRGLRSDVRVREAGGGARPPAVGGDAARLDDRGRAVAGEGAAGDPRASEPAAAGVPGRPGADRRLAARLARGPGAVVHADRVRGRRDVAAAGGGLLPGGDDRGVHADDARAPRLARAAGGVLLGTATGCSG